LKINDCQRYSTHFTESPGMYMMDDLSKLRSPLS
jgi:hypothetical protein